MCSAKWQVCLDLVRKLVSISYVLARHVYVLAHLFSSLKL